MPRAALILSLAVAVGGLAPAASARDPHLEPALVPEGCPACHRGHGLSRSPMLPAPQKQVCLACHDSRARLDQQVLRGAVSPAANPALLGSTLAQPFRHPVDDDAFSERDEGKVTCTSCHSPHRGSPEGRATPAPSGRPYLSPKNPQRQEYELCESCHGNRGSTTTDLSDISRLLNPTNRSYHPVEAPALDRSPSLVTSLSGREINCTDCHGNSNPGGPRGPHGSGVASLLRSQYTRFDGAQESASTYALCYDCHRREAVLASTAFPEHEMHIVEEKASCATCHNPHGSVSNRALIRLGEETVATGVAPSVATGLLAFVSDSPGSGACYLSCHGEDHGPETYGGFLGGNLLAPTDPLGVQPPSSSFPPLPGGSPAPPRPPRRFEPPQP